MNHQDLIKRKRGKSNLNQRDSLYLAKRNLKIGLMLVIDQELCHLDNIQEAI